MSREFACLPTGIGSLPYTEPKQAVEQVLEYFEAMPFWPQLPRRDITEQMYVQFSEHLPGITLSLDQLFLDNNCDLISELENYYNRFLANDSTLFALTKDYVAGFYTLIETLENRTKPYWIKGQMTGPFSFGFNVSDINRHPIIYDEMMRDVLFKCFGLMAKWQIEKLQTVCDEVIFFFDEPWMQTLSNNALLHRDEILSHFVELLEPLEDKLIGLHCCGNVNWNLIIETGVSLISFDAYNFYNEFLLYGESLKEFFKRGGIFVWGIVPVQLDKLVGETSDSLLKLFTKLLERIHKLGIDIDTLLNQSLITSTCGAGLLNIKQAERVMALTVELSEQIREKYKLV